MLQPQGYALTRCALLHARKPRSKAVLHPLPLEKAPFDRPLNGQESLKDCVEPVAGGLPGEHEERPLLPDLQRSRPERVAVDQRVLGERKNPPYADLVATTCSRARDVRRRNAQFVKRAGCSVI